MLLAHVHHAYRHRMAKRPSPSGPAQATRGIFIFTLSMANQGGGFVCSLLFGRNTPCCHVSPPSTLVRPGSLWFVVGMRLSPHRCAGSYGLVPGELYYRLGTGSTFMPPPPMFFSIGKIIQSVLRPNHPSSTSFFVFVPSGAPSMFHTRGTNHAGSSVMTAHQRRQIFQHDQLECSYYLALNIHCECSSATQNLQGFV